METKHNHFPLRTNTEKFAKGYLVSRKTEICSCGAKKITTKTTLDGTKVSNWKI